MLRELGAENSKELPEELEEELPRGDQRDSAVE